MSSLRDDFYSWFFEMNNVEEVLGEKGKVFMVWMKECLSVAFG